MREITDQKEAKKLPALKAPRQCPIVLSVNVGRRKVKLLGSVLLTKHN
jgi:hypothetical protein